MRTRSRALVRGARRAGGGTAVALGREGERARPHACSRPYGEPLLVAGRGRRRARRCGSRSPTRSGPPRSSSSPARPTRFAATGTRPCAASSGPPSTRHASAGPRVAHGPAAPSRRPARRGIRYRTAERTRTGEPRDVALLLAWRASAHWLRAERRRLSGGRERAFEIASEAGDPQALAAAHTVLAMLAALEGDRGANDAHYLRALDYAQQAGDVLQLIRVRTNRGLPPRRGVLVRGGDRGARPRAAARRPRRVRRVPGARAVESRRSALRKLGRFDEARRRPRGVHGSLYQRLGSRMVAYALEKLGEVYRIRGSGARPRRVRGGGRAGGGGGRRPGARPVADRPRADVSSRTSRTRRSGSSSALSRSGRG